MKRIPETVSRRSVIGAMLGGAAVFIPAWNETVEAADAISCVPTTPTVTEGPYWVDEKLFRSDIRTDPSNGSVRTGVPLTLTINIQNLPNGGTCTPLAGAYVDIWHCDAKGIYSDESTYNPGGGTGSVNTVGQKFLRGYQITDENGRVSFTTVYPGWYMGRTIHIHVRVRTYNGSTVLSNFVSQIFFDDAINDVVMANSSYSRNSNRDTRNANDMVYNVANNTRMLATTTGSVASGYAATITMGALFQTPAAGSPAISSGGITNAVSGVAGAASGSWVSIYGTNLASAAKALAVSDIANNAIPTSLGGVSVQINNKPAFVQYVSATQVNVLAPDDSATGNVAVALTNSAGTSNSVQVNLQRFLPGLSVVGGYVRAIRYPDGAIVNGTGAAETGATTIAAVSGGTVISLFGTGFGPTSSNVAVGQIFSGAYQTSNPVTVAIGGQTAQVLWAGLIGPGLYQINVTVPSSLADGEYAVVATVNSVSSQTSALLKVAASARLAGFVRPGRLLKVVAGPLAYARGSWKPLGSANVSGAADVSAAAHRRGGQLRAGPGVPMNRDRKGADNYHAATKLIQQWIGPNEELMAERAHTGCLVKLA
jgi:uncharacterized protein (TIGR03437 family)